MELTFYKTLRTLERDLENHILCGQELSKFTVNYCASEGHTSYIDAFIAVQNKITARELGLN